MSRSRRHFPVMGLCGHSEKWDKQCWHRRFRHRNRQRVRLGLEPLPVRILSNTDHMNKDGKQWIRNPRYFRK